MRGVIIAAMLLSGCGGPSLSDNQRAEVQNIAEDFADGAASDVDASELVSKIEELEGQLELQREQDRLTYQYAKTVSEDMDDLRDHYNQHLSDHHGSR